MVKKVAIIIGSRNDMEYIEGAKEILNEFGIAYDVLVLSAHRTLDKVVEFSQKAEENGFGVIIACAGMAAHLPGVIAAKTHLPVIGVPLPTSDIRGIDALLAIVQMPSGVPVATMAIGRAGVKNAAVLSAQILALEDEGIREKVKKYKESLG
ncbi:MAG: 5-(carboxyamino)imidazole ribonucleotide mutase [Candidatus Omnitrophica bacterium]|nr:5-(carboxyamino)imidazole ribonucleotide mutase [Candidatus Omnitrophota bacterium]MCM8777744.1 5-(carboxyamino)imidazole ribonucleotide mutase [Candidatus Omnitrophota bacterium]